MFEKRVARTTRSATSVLDDVTRRIGSLTQTEGSWYDGTVVSIEKRIHELSAAIREIRAAQQTFDLGTGTAAQLESYKASFLEAEALLRDVVSEVSQSEYLETIQDLPQYSTKAAGENRPLDGDTVDWEKFCALGPAKFIREEASAIGDELEMRERAIAHVLDKTAGVSSDLVRSQVIESFVASVERERRRVQRGRPVAAQVRESSMDGVTDSMLFF